MKRLLRVVIVLALAALFACVTRSPATTWGWSSWYLRGGFGDEDMFKGQRDTCLSQMDVKDPVSITLDSPAENGFVQCMNAAGWCTQLWNCNKPNM